MNKNSVPLRKPSDQETDAELTAEDPGVPDLKTVVEEVTLLDPAIDPDSLSFVVAVVLVAATQVGTNVDDLATYTKYPPELIAAIAQPRGWPLG